MENFGKIFVVVGIVFLLLGIFFSYYGGNFPRMPGDIYIKRDNFTFYFPWVTVLLLNLIITIILNIFFRR